MALPPLSSRPTILDWTTAVPPASERSPTGIGLVDDEPIQIRTIENLSGRDIDWDAAADEFGAYDYEEVLESRPTASHFTSLTPSRVPNRAKEIDWDAAADEFGAKAYDPTQFDWDKAAAEFGAVPLDPAETEFQQWYKRHADYQGLPKDPDASNYDYRAAYAAGKEPTWGGMVAGWQWPEEFQIAGPPPLPPRTTYQQVVEAPGRVAGELAAGYLGFGGGVWGVAAGAAENLGLESIAEFARGSTQAAAGAGEYLAGTHEGMSETESAIYSGIRSMGQSLPAMAAGAITMSPGVTLGLMGATTAGQAYIDADQSLSPERRALYAGIHGAIEVATEKIPVGRLFDDLAKKAGLLAAIKHALLPELVGEQVATAGQDFNDWYTLPENKDKTIEDYLAARPGAAYQTAIATLVSTIAQTSVMHMMARGVDRQTNAILLDGVGGEAAAAVTAQAMATPAGQTTINAPWSVQTAPVVEDTRLNPPWPSTATPAAEVPIGEPAPAPPSMGDLVEPAPSMPTPLTTEGRAPRPEYPYPPGITESIFGHLRYIGYEPDVIARMTPDEATEAIDNPEQRIEPASEVPLAQPAPARKGQQAAPAPVPISDQAGEIAIPQPAAGPGVEIPSPPPMRPPVLPAGAPPAGNVPSRQPPRPPSTTISPFLRDTLSYLGYEPPVIERMTVAEAVEAVKNPERRIEPASAEPIQPFTAAPQPEAPAPAAPRPTIKMGDNQAEQKGRQQFTAAQTGDRLVYDDGEEWEVDRRSDRMVLLYPVDEHGVVRREHPRVAEWNDFVVPNLRKPAAAPPVPGVYEPGQYVTWRGEPRQVLKVRGTTLTLGPGATNKQTVEVAADEVEHSAPPAPPKGNRPAQPQPPTTTTEDEDAIDQDEGAGEGEAGDDLTRRLEEDLAGADLEGIEGPRTPHSDPARADAFEYFVKAARALNPRVDEDRLRQEFDLFHDLWDEGRATEAENHPIELLKFIAKHGGIHEKKAGWWGEMARLREGRAFGNIAGVNGVLSVQPRRTVNVRKRIDGEWVIRREERGGRSLDGMLELIKEEQEASGRFLWIQEFDDIIEFLNKALVEGLPAKAPTEMPRSAINEVVVNFTRRAQEAESDSIVDEDDELDDTFDPDELEGKEPDYEGYLAAYDVWLDKTDDPSHDTPDTATAHLDALAATFGVSPEDARKLEMGIKPGEPGWFVEPDEEDEEGAVDEDDDEEPPKEVIVFRSGNIRAPADFEGYAKANAPIGTTAQAGKKILARVVEYLNAGGRVFMDSGSFSNPTLDFGPVLQLYKDITAKLEDDATDRFTVVAPDRVGDPIGSRTVLKRHEDDIDFLLNEGVDVVIPVQVGPDFIKDALDIRQRFPRARLALPSNKAAINKSQLDTLLRRLREMEPGIPDYRLSWPFRGIHFLGISEKSKGDTFANFTQAVRESFPEATISTDAVRIRAQAGDTPSSREVDRRTEEQSEQDIDDVPDSDTTELFGAFFRGDLGYFDAGELEQIAAAIDAATMRGTRPAPAPKPTPKLITSATARQAPTTDVKGLSDEALQAEAEEAAGQIQYANRSKSQGDNKRRWEDRLEALRWELGRRQGLTTTTKRNVTVGTLKQWAKNEGGITEALENLGVDDRIVDGVMSNIAKARALKARRPGNRTDVIAEDEDTGPDLYAPHGDEPMHPSVSKALEPFLRKLLPNMPPARIVHHLPNVILVMPERPGEKRFGFAVRGTAVEGNLHGSKTGKDLLSRVEKLLKGKQGDAFRAAIGAEPLVPLPVRMPFSEGALTELLNNTPEQAVAVKALFEGGMGLDLSGVEVVKNVTPGEGALEQGAVKRALKRMGAWLRNEWERSKPKARPMMTAEETETWLNEQEADFKRKIAEIREDFVVKMDDIWRQSVLDAEAQAAEHGYTSDFARMIRLRRPELFVYKPGDIVEAEVRPPDVLKQRKGMFDEDEDVLDTGEVQPRLPGDVGAVREEERPTPQEELPDQSMTLTAEEAERRQATLFGEPLKPAKAKKGKPKDPGQDVLFQMAHADTWYYDNIQAALKDPKAPKKGTAEQFIAHLKKHKGSMDQAAEIGLDEWFKTQTGTITVEAVQAFVTANEIHLEETILDTESLGTPSQKARVDEETDKRWQAEIDDWVAARADMAEGRIAISRPRVVVRLVGDTVEEGFEYVLKDRGGQIIDADTTDNYDTQDEATEAGEAAADRLEQQWQDQEEEDYLKMLRREAERDISRDTIRNTVEEEFKEGVRTQYDIYQLEGPRLRYREFLLYADDNPTVRAAEAELAAAKAALAEVFARQQAFNRREHGGYDLTPEQKKAYNDATLRKGRLRPQVDAILKEKAKYAIYQHVTEGTGWGLIGLEQYLIDHPEDIEGPDNIYWTEQDRVVMRPFLQASRERASIVPAQRLIDQQTEKDLQQEWTDANTRQAVAAKNVRQLRYETSHWPYGRRTTRRGDYRRLAQSLMAHIRLSVRTLPDGRQVAMVEEFQSDLHQAGRKKGYKYPGLDRDRFAADTAADQAKEKAWPLLTESRLFNKRDGYLYYRPPALLKYLAKLDKKRTKAKKAAIKEGLDPEKAAAKAAEKYPDPFAVENWSEDERATVNDYLAAAKKQERLKSAEDEGVGITPFENNWKRIALKRVLALAAEEGLDGVAWTTGVQQAARFQDQLRNQVDEITWTEEPAEALDRWTWRQATGPDQWTPENERSMTFELVDRDGEVPNKTYTSLDEVIAEAQRRNNAVPPVKVVRAKRDGVIVFDGKVVDGTFITGPGKDKEADEVLGEEVAEMVESTPQGGFKSKDLTVGGEGMKGFYDREMVNLANDLAKSLKIPRVSQVEVDVTGQGWLSPHHYEGPDITVAEVQAKLDDLAWPRADRLRLEDMVNQMHNGATFVEALDDISGSNVTRRHIARVFGGDYVRSSGRAMVHFLATPKEMRDQVEKYRLPLYQKQERLDHQGAKAAVMVTSDASAIIYALEKPDVASSIHELAHIARRWLMDRDIKPEFRQGITDEDIATAAKWAGAKLVKGEWVWSEKAEEKFARGFERYMRDGISPTEKLKAVFQKFAEWLTDIYKQIEGSPIDVDISPEMRLVFDKLVTRVERIQQKEGRTPKGPKSQRRPYNAKPIKPLKPGTQVVAAAELTPRGLTRPATPAERAVIFQPGNVVSRYGGGKDKVISYFEGDTEQGWHVVVQGVGEDHQRSHATNPNVVKPENVEAANKLPTKPMVYTAPELPKGTAATKAVPTNNPQNLTAEALQEAWDEAQDALYGTGPERAPDEEVDAWDKRLKAVEKEQERRARAKTGDMGPAPRKPKGGAPAPKPAEPTPPVDDDVAAFDDDLAEIRGGKDVLYQDAPPSNADIDYLKGQHKVTTTVANGIAYMSGKTYDIKDTIKAVARSVGYTNTWDSSRKLWSLPETAIPQLVSELRRGGGTRVVSDLRKQAEARPNRSELEHPISHYVGADTIKIITDGALKIGMPQFVIDEQIEDVARIVRAHIDKMPAFLLASEPGSGKTFVLGGAIRELKKRGVKKITYVTLRQELITQIKDDLKAFGIEGVTDFITYPAMREADPKDTEVLIFDEAHSVKNVAGGPAGARQAQQAARWIQQSGLTVLASATPFENPVQAEYLKPTGLFDPFGGFTQFAKAYGATTFSLASGNEVLTWQRTRTSDADAAAARQWMMNEGVFTSRRTRLPEGQVESRLVKVHVPVKDSNRYAAISEAAAHHEDDLGGFGAAWIINFQKRLLEAAKVKFAIEEAQKALDSGRFPILFVETKAERRIDIPDLVQREAEWQQAVGMAQMSGDTRPKRSEFGLPPLGVVDVLARYMQMTGESIIHIPSAEDVVRDHFGVDKVAIFTGSVSPKKAQDNLDAWRKGTKPILVATMAKGGTGLSLHDKVGNHQTTQINVNMPWTATGVVQVTQRSARYGLKGNAEIQWIFAENIPFDRALSAKVGGRMADMGAAVHGERIARSDEIEDWNFEDKPLSTRRMTVTRAELEALAAKKNTTVEVQIERAHKAGYYVPGSRYEGGDEPPARGSRGAAVGRFGVPAGTAAPHVYPSNAAKAPRAVAARTGSPHILPVHATEIVGVALDLLGGKLRVASRFRSAGVRAQFKARGGEAYMIIGADLFKPGNEAQLAATLAHEFGHWIDWLSSKDSRRGNILGRLQSLHRFLRHTYTAKDGQTIKVKEVREELIRLSAAWRPWPKTYDASFKAYRNSSHELYADAISVLFNDPAKLQREAPIFWKEWFSELDKKPEVANAYFELQELLGGTPEELAPRRRAGNRHMFEKADLTQQEIEKTRQTEREKAEGSHRDRLKIEWIDKNMPVIKAMEHNDKVHGPINPDRDPRYLMSEMRHMDAKQRGFLERTFDPISDKLKAVGLDWHTFGEALFYERIVDGDRWDLANPRHNPPTVAAANLKDLWDGLSAEQKAVLRQAIATFRAAVAEVAEAGYDAGLYTDERHKDFQDNPAWAGFRVIEYMDQHVTATIHHQKGTLREIQNPADSSMLKMLAIIKEAERNKMVHQVVLAIQKRSADDAIKAPKVWDANAKRIVFKESPHLHLKLVVYKVQGVAQGYWVPISFADAILNVSVGQNLATLASIRNMNRVWFRPVFTGINVGFQLANFIRDFSRYWFNMPNTSLRKALTNYYRAIPVAYARGVGRKHADIQFMPKKMRERALRDLQEMGELRMLGMTWNDAFASREFADNQLEETFIRHGLNGPPGPSQNKVLKGWSNFLDGLEGIGNFVETLPKAAAVYELKGAGKISDLNAKQRAFIREKVGSPDFRQGGTAKPLTNEIFLFSNAIIQAIRGDLHIAFRGDTKMQFWLKTFGAVALPVILTWMLENFGDRWDDDEEEGDDFRTLTGWKYVQRILQGATEYDKTNYHIIPHGLDEHGNSQYWRIPRSDFGRLVGGLIRQGLNASKGDVDLFNGLAQMIAYVVGQAPTPTPILTLAKDTGYYLANQQIYDSFHGRVVFTKDEMDMGIKERFPKFFAYQWQNMGGNIVMKFNAFDRPEELTDAQKLIELPFMGNVAGRFFRITNYGHIETLEKAGAPVRYEKALERKNENDAVSEALAEYRALAPPDRTRRKQQELALKATTELYADKPRKEQNEQYRQILKKIQMGVARGKSDPVAEAVIRTDTTDEAVVVINRAFKDKSSRNGWISDARQAGVISEAVVKAIHASDRSGAQP